MSVETEVDTNSIWREAPDSWLCPVCRRNKHDIVRRAASNRLMAAIVIHHDHFGDMAANEIMCYYNNNGYSIRERRRLLAQGRHLVSFLEAFRRVAVCQGCNHAEADAKRLVEAPAQFSFGPVDMHFFCKAGENGTTDINEARLFAVWQRREPLLLEREHFLNVHIGRMVYGKAWWEPEPLSGSDGFGDWAGLMDSLSELPGSSFPQSLLMKSGDKP